MRLRIPQILLCIAIVFALVAVPLSMVEAHTSSDAVGSSILAAHSAPDTTAAHRDHSGHMETLRDASGCPGGLGTAAHHSGDSSSACCYGMCLADAVVAGNLSSRDRVPSQFVREAPTAFKCADLVAPHSPPRA